MVIDPRMKVMGLAVKVLVCVLMALAMASVPGCELFSPTVEGPVSHKPVSVEAARIEMDTQVAAKTQEQKELAEKLKREQAARDADFQRAVAKLRRQTETQIAAVRDAAAEALDAMQIAYDRSTGEAAAAFESASATTALELKQMQARLSNSIDELTARQEKWTSGLAMLGGLAQGTGIPGVALGGSALLMGIGWMKSHGAAKTAEAKGRADAEKAASDAHDDAWEESKANTLDFITRVQGLMASGTIKALPAGTSVGTSAAA